MTINVCIIKSTDELHTQDGSRYSIYPDNGAEL